jgi:hypothetical protein
MAFPLFLAFAALLLDALGIKSLGKQCRGNGRNPYPSPALIGVLDEFANKPKSGS